MFDVKQAESYLAMLKTQSTFQALARAAAQRFVDNTKWVPDLVEQRNLLIDYYEFSLARVERYRKKMAEDNVAGDGFILYGYARARHEYEAKMEVLFAEILKLNFLLFPKEKRPNQDDQ
jgi:nucleoid-associated protein YejK